MAAPGVLADYDDEPTTAAELGVATRTLARWRAKRVGPPVTFVGRKPLYYRPSVTAWLRGCEIPMVRERRSAGTRP